MTPLQVCALVLAQERRTEPPVTPDARALRRWLREHARCPREREIAGYLIAACGRGRLGRRGGGGSLKHVLWWLRDYGGEAYPAAARALVRYLLDHPAVPLHDVVDHLPLVPAAASFAEMIRAGADGAFLAESHLEARRVGRWTVAINRTPLNLLGVAMRHTRADVYVAASARGAVIKPRRELSFPLAPLVARLGDGWAQPYPDLAVRRGRAGEEDLNTILEVIERAR
jgi:hypothetical protein